MQPQGTPTVRGGIVVARGYGLKIYVERGHLVVHDGVGRTRVTRRFSRSSRQLRRLVVLGHSGYVTLEAVRWLQDTTAPLMHLDVNGRVLALSAPCGPDLPALRRTQALLDAGPVGVGIARDLLLAKVEGQQAVAAEPLGGGSLKTIERSVVEIESAETLEELLTAEAQAASAYWGTWSTLGMPFSKRDGAQLPEHWLTFGQRASLLTNGPRLASNPAGAMLNYLYALLEAETILACIAVGLDPGIGIFHADRRDRSSMALDAMEAPRPAIDAYLLALLTQRALSRRDFIETRQGACRLHPHLAAQLAETCLSWANLVAPVVERVAHAVGRHSTSAVPRLTPLTGTNSKTAWDERKPDRRRRQKRAGALVLPDVCRGCGAELPSRRRRYCDRCRRERWEREAHQGRANAAHVLARLRSEQRDPAHGGEAAKLRGAKNAEHQRAVRWTGQRPDPGIFATEILPGLRDLPIAQLVDATGLSEHYCSLIRLGKRVPHPRHWHALSGLPKESVGRGVQR